MRLECIPHTFRHVVHISLQYVSLVLKLVQSYPQAVIPTLSFNLFFSEGINGVSFVRANLISEACYAVISQLSFLIKIPLKDSCEFLNLGQQYLTLC